MKKEVFVFFFLCSSLCFAPSDKKQYLLDQPILSWYALTAKEKAELLDDAIAKDHEYNPDLYIFRCPECKHTGNPYSAKHKSFYDIHRKYFHQNKKP